MDLYVYCQEELDQAMETGEPENKILCCAGTFWAPPERIIEGHWGSTIVAGSGARVHATIECVVWALRNSMVWAHQGSVVIADKGSVVEASQGSVVIAGKGSVVEASSGSTVSKKKGSIVVPFPGAEVILTP